MSGDSKKNHCFPGMRSLGRRSQSELLGFTVVIMLIAVGMLFVIGFSVLSQDTDTRTLYLYKQLATNTNDAILETTTTCKSLTLRELLVSCADDPNRAICPPDDRSTLGQVTTTCDYAHAFIDKRLKEILDNRGYDYEYTLRPDVRAAATYSTWSGKDRSETSPSVRASCGERQRAPLILPAQTQSVVIYLDIYSCSK